MTWVKGVIFDLDGVIVENKLNFKKISIDIFGKEQFPLLERILKIKDPSQRKRAYTILERYETEAASICKLKEGIEELFDILDRYEVKKGVVTRNCRKSVDLIMARFGIKFDVVVTREDAPPKPSKDSVVYALRKLNLSPFESILVGDYEFDMVAGKKAGVFTIFLKSSNHYTSRYADLTLESIPQLSQYLKRIFEKEKIY